MILDSVLSGRRNRFNPAERDKLFDHFVARASTFGSIVKTIRFAVPRPAGGIFPFTIGMASSNYAADTLFKFRTEGGDT